MALTVAELLSYAATLPGDSARRDAEILLCHCLDKSRVWLYSWPEKEIPVAQASQYKTLIESRKQGHPVAYLIGRRDFWSLSIRVNEHTLIPRPETESLVEWALALNLPEDASVLDAGTGSGAIALALASEHSNWKVSGSDVSEEALEVASKNALEQGLANVYFISSNWFEALDDQHFHLIASNPPYIEEGDNHLSTGDLRFEPITALMAADAGMADLVSVVNEAPNHLHIGGWLLVEHGFEQGEKVRNLFTDRGFTGIETRRDLAGLERITGGCWHVE